MDNKGPAVSINLYEGSISISGSEEFIEKNLKVVFDYVEKNILTFPRATTTSDKLTVVDPLKNIPVTDTVSSDHPKVSATPLDDKFIKAGVYHIDSEDGTISILKKVPGDSKSEKVKNIALIVLYIKKGKIPGKDIIPICEKHACYDSSNFSATFKNEKTNIIKKGTGQSWTIELTQPGEIAALALLEEMANDKK